MKSRLTELMDFYGIAELSDLGSAIERHYQDAAVSTRVLGQLYRNSLRRFPVAALLDLCRIFGLTQLSQLIDFDHAMPTRLSAQGLLKYPPATVTLHTHLHKLMKQREVDQWTLHVESKISTTTVGRWFNDFPGLQAIGFDTLDRLGEALNLQTIDQLCILETDGKLPPVFNRKTIYERLQVQPYCAHVHQNLLVTA